MLTAGVEPGGIPEIGAGCGRPRARGVCDGFNGTLEGPVNLLISWPELSLAQYLVRAAPLVHIGNTAASYRRCQAGSGCRPSQDGLIKILIHSERCDSSLPTFYAGLLAYSYLCNCSANSHYRVAGVLRANSSTTTAWSAQCRRGNAA